MNSLIDEDVGNIISLEHVNLQVPDQPLAMLFYVVGLGLTRDPFINVGLNNMWVNAGEQQFHLPTRPAQVIHGHIALVVPELEALAKRLASIEPGLRDTRFSWSMNEDHVAVTCPWGNRLRCYAAGSQFGDMTLGIPHVEFLVMPGAAKAIAQFYAQALRAFSTVERDAGGEIGCVRIGRNQFLRFRETSDPILPYDGHHVAIYVANFSHPYGWLKDRGLITEDVRGHQFRFRKLVDPVSGEPVFSVEHEVRSLHHPMFQRNFINRDPNQSQRAYRRGRDGFIPFQ
ncbi:MAG: hypothetical protein ACM3TN_23115 [Alphaproteobacteria bacterium]